MELSKHKAHRNPAYLNWLRKQNCVVSGKKAQCAHHIRLGTNGGTGLKPSDYFCIPLTNEFHTTGPNALHLIGEETFLREFKINPLELFVGYLTDYLAQRFEVLVARDDKPAKRAVSDLITIIETESLKYKKQEKPKAKVVAKKDPKYEKAKKLKNERDKNLRQKLKVPSKDNEFYQIAKNVKRERERVLREKMKDNQSEALEKAKEANKVRQKEFRKKLAKKKKAKAKQSRK
mgnify:CR=1 FL=1|tara:strand:- start:33184 stop:33882 length:699 start_codon:yes stop_codon:yes gene_type:complete